MEQDLTPFKEAYKQFLLDKKNGKVFPSSKLDISIVLKQIEIVIMGKEGKLPPIIYQNGDVLLK